ncbi:MAG TPA: hypothetical protein VJS92_06985 [Candidatus Polarisedimenticolaceae bacterium]|nr:hypothetical protein [Candidatus Polarisedimenticolaceae bacterium]
MSGRVATWLWGCGLGCLVLVLVGVGSTGLFLWKVSQGFESSVEAERRLAATHGEAASFTPAPDGKIPPERIEAFLRVRETTAAERERLAGLFLDLAGAGSRAQNLEQRPIGEKLRAVFGVAGSAFGLARALGEFFAARDRALVAAGMGSGEYAYLYALAYWAWLDHAPGDSAEHELPPDPTGARPPSGLETPPTSRRQRELRTMLHNQLGALPAGAEPSWRAALEAEVRALDEDPDRYPWRGAELPPALAGSLEPYRARLAASYRAATNPFELARAEKRGPMSYQAD